MQRAGVNEGFPAAPPQGGVTKKFRRVEPIYRKGFRGFEVRIENNPC